MFYYSLLSLLVTAVPITNTTEVENPNKKMGAPCLEQPGDVIIGGIFPIYMTDHSPMLTFTRGPLRLRSSRITAWSYWAIRIFTFATEEINRDIHLLPNLTIGFSIWDSGGFISGALQGTISLLTGSENSIPNYSCGAQPPLLALIGESQSALSIPMARLLGLYKFPQVSYSSTAVSLSDKIEFPSFLRTISSDQSWAQGVALLLRYFNWTWVGIVTQDDDFGIQGSSLLITELEKIGACKEFFITISISKSSEKIQHEYKKQLRTSTSKVIVMFLNSMSFPHIYEGLSVSDIRGKIWIRSNVQENEVQQSNLGMSQTISILRSKVIIPGFSEFLNQMHPSRNEENIFIKTFWEENFDCKWPGQGLGPQGNSTDTGEVKFCTKVEHLQGQFMSALIETYNTYTAVYSIAYALQDLSSQDDGRRPFKSKTYAKERDIQPWQILLYLKNVHFKAPNGKRVTFNANGDFFERYDILNWQETPRGSFHSVKIGYIDPMASTGEELMINKSTLIWRGGASQVPLSVCSESCPPGFNQIPSSNRPHCCFDCSLCPEGQYSDIRDAEQCIECPEDQYPNKERNDCLPKTEIFLSFEEPLGMTLTCVSVFFSTLTALVLILFVKHQDSPIVKANNRGLSYTLLISLIFCFSCSLLFIGRPTTATCFLRQTVFGITFTVAISSILAKTITVVLAFRVKKPGSRMKKYMRQTTFKTTVLVCSLIQAALCGIWLGTSPPFLHNDSQSEPGFIVIECNKGSISAYYCVLGYMGLLALVSFIVAFLARSLPNTFNEAKFITFSMLVFCSVWISFLPTYHSTKGKAMVSMEIFSILASSAALFTFIFIPKCYIILLRPEKNVQGYLKKI